MCGALFALASPYAVSEFLFVAIIINTFRYVVSVSVYESFNLFIKYLTVLMMDNLLHHHINRISSKKLIRGLCFIN